MVDIILQIAKIMVPPILTGTVGYKIAKFNKNKEYYEIAYTNVYYPIYFEIAKERDTTPKQKKDSIDYNKFVNQVDFYISRWQKYVDRSTILSFKQLKLAVKEQDKEKYAYDNFCTNICRFNSKIRKSLGYLEPSMFLMYKSYHGIERDKLNACFSFITLSFSVYAYSILGIFKKVSYVLLAIIILSSIATVIFAVIIGAKKALSYFSDKKKSGNRLVKKVTNGTQQMKDTF